MKVHIALILCLSIALLCSCKKENKPGNNEQTPEKDSLTVYNKEGLPYLPEDPDPYRGFTVYNIQKDKNYCDNNDYPILREVEQLNFLVVFDSSCIYTNVLPENQADINKLMGFSDCETHHQTNSARFGWNWMDGKLYLYAYCYRDKNRIYKNLGPVALYTKHHLRLSVTDYNYIFEVNGKTDTMPRHCSGNSIYGYQLLPYFGGDEPAPHDICIRIKYL